MGGIDLEEVEVRLSTTTLVFEGTPAELDATGLRSVFATRVGGGDPSDSVGATGGALPVNGNGSEVETLSVQSNGSEGDSTSVPARGHELPPEVRALLDREFTPADVRDLAEAFLVTVLGWGDVRAELPRYHAYVRLVRFGARGAFAYVRRKKVYLKLPDDATVGRRYARLRAVKGKSNPRVIAPLESREQLQEALALARVAYDSAV
jgi:hypothetical protein